MDTIDLNFNHSSLLSTFFQLEEIPYDNNGLLLPEIDIKDSAHGDCGIRVQEENVSNKYLLIYNMFYSVIAINLKTQKHQFVFQCTFIGEFEFIGIASVDMFEKFQKHKHFDYLVDNLAPRLLFGEIRRYALDILFKAGIRNIAIPEAKFEVNK